MIIQNYTFKFFLPLCLYFGISSINAQDFPTPIILGNGQENCITNPTQQADETPTQGLDAIAVNKTTMDVLSAEDCGLKLVQGGDGNSTPLHTDHPNLKKFITIAHDEASYDAITGVSSYVGIDEDGGMYDITIDANGTSTVSYLTDVDVWDVQQQLTASDVKKVVYDSGEIGILTHDGRIYFEGFKKNNQSSIKDISFARNLVGQRSLFGVDDDDLYTIDIVGTQQATPVAGLPNGLVGKEISNDGGTNVVVLSENSDVYTFGTFGEGFTYIGNIQSVNSISALEDQITSDIKIVGINSIFQVITQNASVVLPITGIKLTGKQYDKGISIDFEVLGTFKDGTVAQIIRINDRIESMVANVNLKSGEYFYNVVDDKPQEGNNQYKIRTTEPSGNIFESKIVSVKFSSEDVISLNANISNGSPLRIVNYDGVGIIRIRTIMGQLTNNTSINDSVIDISNLPNGHYIVSIENQNNNTLHNLRFVVVK